MKVPIRIYNRFLDLKSEIDTYQSLQYGRSYHGVASFELHINRYMHEAKNLNKGDIIVLDKQPNKAGIILTKEIVLDEKGRESENFKLTGYTLDGLMFRRITVPPSHTSHDRKSGNAETVMKHYVYNHFVNPADTNRVMPHIEVAPNYNRGNYIEWESRYKNVAEELENISIKSGLGWGIFADFKTKKLIFDVIIAKDLTQDNPYGNNPVFFSPEFETIKSQSFVDSDNDLKTVGYVGGQGEGVERKIVTIGSKTGWERIETFVDARDVGTEDEEAEEKLTDEEIEQQLIERGKSKMSEMENIRSLEAEILTPVKDITPFQYEKDYDLGDVVQVVNKSWGLTMEAPITEFKEIHEPGGFRLEATFGRTRPTFISKLKNKFNELEGVEKQELPAQIAVETKRYTDHKVTKEEQERIEQAKDNLEASKEFTKGYAEKKRVESPNEPIDKSVIWVDTSDLDNVVWKVWNETEGMWKAGPGGPQGLPGPAGKDGKTLYTWLKYADDEKGNGISDSPDGKKYIGLSYNNTSSKESMNPSDYKWSKIEGEKGDTGVQGPPGKDGQPTYTWIKYADDAQGSGFSDSPDGKEYIGLAYNKTTPSESSNPNDYTWAKIKGEKGEKGDRGPQGIQGLQGPRGDRGIPGTPGKDGRTAYTHIAYADDDKGNGFSQNPTNKKYIGMYADHNPTDSTNPSDYKWSLIKGQDGAQGVPGKPGQDGRTPYFHTAYANSADGRKDFSTTDSLNKAYIGTYTDFIPQDSTDPLKYNWTKVKGDRGPQGPTGPRGPNIVDTNTSFGVNWLIADYIKSLNGLNINNQFVVDDNGDVRIGNDRITINVGGKNVGIKVRNGNFYLEDDITNMQYSATPKRNLIRDHSFELVLTDPKSMGSDSVKYNWLDMRMSDNIGDNHWVKTREPKVAVVFSPSDASVLPIKGDKAIVVRDANFVRQSVYDGIAGGVTYTVSAYFKRQHNVAPGGIPRFEIDHRNAAGNFVSRLIDHRFPAVPDDYSVVRRAVTFTVPKSFSNGDYLDFKISGGNDKWVQCDGVQLVEGNIPTIYDSEDSIWHLANGTYPSKNNQYILWAGAYYLRSDHTVRPSKKLNDCINGWLLEWGAYQPGSGLLKTDYQYTIVPKAPSDRNSCRTQLYRGGVNTWVHKYFYVDNDKITGHDSNGSGNNRYYVLAGVYEI